MAISRLAVVTLGGLMSIISASAQELSTPTDKNFYVPCGNGGYKEGQIIKIPSLFKDCSCCWSEYSDESRNSVCTPKSEMRFSKLEEFGNAGIRVDYTTPAGRETYWQGISAVLNNNLSAFEGIELSVKGDGSLSIQLIEGERGAGIDEQIYFGEVFEKIIIPKSVWEVYKIPFRDFSEINDISYTKETQQGRNNIMGTAFDNNFNLRNIHSLNLEFLCSNASNSYLEIKNISFYKKNSKEDNKNR